MAGETAMTSGKVSFLFNPGHHQWEEPNILPRSACGGRKQSPSCLCICKFTLPRSKTMGTNIVKHGRGGGDGTDKSKFRRDRGSTSNKKWGREKERSPIFVFPHVLKDEVCRCMLGCMCKCTWVKGRFAFQSNGKRTIFVSNLKVARQIRARLNKECCWQETTTNRLLALPFVSLSHSWVLSRHRLIAPGN